MTVQGTMALPAGKFYWEYTVGATVNDQVGIGTMLVVGGSADGTAGARYLNGGTFQSSYTTPSSAASYTTGDVIGMAYDQPNGTLAFYKNNSLQGTVTNISTSEVFFPLRSPNSSGSGGAGVFNFGQRPFAYTPPTGFVALNTFNLPTPTIGATASTTANKYMDAKTYTGTGATQTITVDFASDFAWLKRRDGAGANVLLDILRLTGSLPNRLFSNSTDAESTTADGQNSFSSTGIVLDGSGSGGEVNTSGRTYVAWQWKANGAGSTNTAGSINSTVSANTTAGFSIVTYTGTGSASDTVGHGLGVTPAMVITKRRSSGSGAFNWMVKHSSLASNHNLLLESTGASTDVTSGFGSGGIANLSSSTTFGFLNGTSSNPNNANTSGATYVAYCFAQVAGYSAMGSYTGNGSSDGVFVFTGFRPKYVLIKRTDSADHWTVQDAVREPSNVSGLRLYPNQSVAEDGSPSSTAYIDILSNGFKIRTSDSQKNANGGTYIYYAVAENPFKYAVAR